MPFKSVKSRLLALAATFALGALAAPVTASAQTPTAEARGELYRLRTQIAREMRARPELVQARAEWMSLRSQYQSIRRQVIEQLSNDGAYLSVRAEMWEAEDELEALALAYRNGIVPREPKLALSQKILDRSMKLTEMERVVVDQHAEAAQARQAYLEAGRRLLEVRREIQADIASDPRVREALDRLARAKDRPRRWVP